MRTRTLLRTSSALWASPLALGLVLFYYAVNGREDAFWHDLDYAPTLVGAPLDAAYPFAYAVTSALAAWESARLRRGSVWELAPGRSRYRVAALSLLPVVGLGWLMLLLPPTLALAEAGVFPSLPSLGPLAMGLVLCAAHAVVGFTVGRYLSPVIATPLLAIGVWVLVAFSTVSPSWRNHVFGRYPAVPGFGDVASPLALTAHLLPACGVALGAGLLWAPIRWFAVRVGLALVVAAAATQTAYAVVRDWEDRDALDTVAIPLVCEGTAPKVCMPEFTERDIGGVHAEVSTAYADFEELGVTGRPDTVLDTLGRARDLAPGAGDVRRLGLTSGERDGDLRYRVVEPSVDFPCDNPDYETMRLVTRWVSERTGVAGDFEADFAAEDPPYAQRRGDALREQVAEVLGTPPGEQRAWYADTLASACEDQP